MKRLISFMFAAVLTVTSIAVFPAMGASTQQDVVTMVKKGSHKTKRGTKVVYHRTKVGGKWVYRKGKKGGKYTYHKVKRGGKWTYVKTRNFVVGKPKRIN